MNKIIVLLAVVASTGCAEGMGNVALIGGGGHAASAGGADAPSQPARVVAYEAPVREAPARLVHHRDADFVVCAQCRR